MHASSKAMLNWVVDPFTTTLWRQGWMSRETLDVEPHLMQNWEPFLFKLIKSHTRLFKDEDTLVYMDSQ